MNEEAENMFKKEKKRFKKKKICPVNVKDKF